MKYYWDNRGYVIRDGSYLEVHVGPHPYFGMRNAKFSPHLEKHLRESIRAKNNIELKNNSNKSW